MISRLSNICKVIIKSSELKCVSMFSRSLINNANFTSSFQVHHFCTESNKQEDNANISEENIQLIAGDDQSLQHKLRVLILETEVMRQEGLNVPENTFLKIEHWKELLKLNTRSSRRKYLTYLFKLEKKKENIMEKKQKKRVDRELTLEIIKQKPENPHLTYDLGHNNIFLRFFDTTINHLYNFKLTQAMQFGQKLVIDCGYEKNMVTRENKNCAKQLMLLFGDNRIADDPYDLHFCNADPDSSLMKYFHKHMPTVYDASFPLHLHKSSYLDIFPKNNLVYLTPHCREEMIKYDHDAIYIIGGLVDKMNNEPLSLAKAKMEGLKMQKLPLDRYLQWGSGAGKSLTLNQIISILLDVKRTNNWDFALRHVPTRKLFKVQAASPPQMWKVGREQRNSFDNKYKTNGNKRTQDGRVRINSIFNE